jgi:hypothetical protein
MPILSAIYQNGLGTSAEDALEIFDKLRTAPRKYLDNITDASTMSTEEP